MRPVAVTTLALLLLCAPVLAPAATMPLRLATWNLEWLVSPQTAQAARLACLRGARARLPCEVALDGARSSSDFAALARYARELDADVIALQEVEDADTAARVFPGYAFCMTGRREPQNVGFAIRAGLPHRCGPDYLPLALGDSVRRGAVLVLDPGGPAELHLLAVHLKSGCARGPLDSAQTACGILRQQLPILAEWIAARGAAGQRFAVLGDFNRDFDEPPAGVIDVAAGRAFVGCHAGQTFTRYIDHILVGKASNLDFAPDSLRRTRYRAADVRHYRLSDHCPLGVTLRIAPLKSNWGAADA